MTHELHDSKCLGTGFSEPSSERVPESMRRQVAGQLQSLTHLPGLFIQMRLAQWPPVFAVE